MNPFLEMNLSNWKALQRLEDGRLRCDICLWQFKLREGQHGLCFGDQRHLHDPNPCRPGAILNFHSSFPTEKLGPCDGVKIPTEEGLRAVLAD